MIDNMFTYLSCITMTTKLPQQTLKRSCTLSTIRLLKH